MTDTSTDATITSGWPEPRPCVGCGYCCLKAKCTYGQVHGGDVHPCQFLIWSEPGQRYVCELVIKAGPGSSQAEGLAIGAGCCSGMNTWRQDVRRRH